MYIIEEYLIEYYKYYILDQHPLILKYFLNFCYRNIEPLKYIEFIYY